MIFSTYPKGVQARRKNHGPTIGRNPDARAKTRLSNQRQRVAANRALRALRTLDPDTIAKDGLGLSRRNNIVKLYDV